MRYYPLLLDLHEKNCLVVGTGKVGMRKIKTLLKAEPGHVLALDTAPFDDDLRQLADNHPNLFLCKRAFEPKDLDDVHLVFVCTDNRAVNASIARACKEKGIFCNIANDPDAGDAVLPSIIQRGDLLITLSTSGKSPALCKALRQELDCQFGKEYDLLLRLLGRVREALLPLGYDSDTNAGYFRSLVASSLLTALAEHDAATVTSILENILPQELHPAIAAMTHNLFTISPATPCPQ